jgi:hypothetical protein
MLAPIDVVRSSRLHFDSGFLRYLNRAHQASSSANLLMQAEAFDKGRVIRLPRYEFAAGFHRHPRQNDCFRMRCIFWLFNSCCETAAIAADRLKIDATKHGKLHEIEIATLSGRLSFSRV